MRSAATPTHHAAAPPHRPSARGALLVTATTVLLAAGCGGGGSGSGSFPGGDGGDVPLVCTVPCPAGYSCQAGVCTGGSPTSLALDARSVELAGVLTFDGAPATSTSKSCSQLASVTLASTSGASFSTDIPCSRGDGSFSLRVAPGTYRVLARASSYATGAPSGTFVVERAFAVTAAKSGLAFDARSVPVSGTLRFDGSPPHASSGSCSQMAAVTFTSSDGASFGADLPCATSGGAFAARVAPGTYVVTARATSYAVGAPPGTFVVNDARTIGSSGESGVALDVTSVPLSGRATWNGAPPQALGKSCSQLASVALFDGRGASFSADIPCSVADGAFALRVAPGTYTVTARASSYASGLAQGTFIVAKSLAVTGARSDLALDVKTVAVAGHLAFDGAPPPSTSKSCSQLASVQLIGDFVLDPGILGALGFGHGTIAGADIPCSASDGAFSVQLAPGTYRVTARASSYAMVPTHGTFALDQARAITGPTSDLQLDAKSRPVAGRLTFDGAPPASTSKTCSQLASVSFTATTGASFSVDIPCSETDGHFFGAVGAGTYRVTARASSYAVGAPTGTFVLADRLAVP